MEELRIIQKELKAPKGLYNQFGKFKYRSTELIMEAVKPLLFKNDCVLTMTDDIVDIGGRIYVKSTATLVNKDGKSVVTTGFAREPERKSGMDESQITGAASSYARKYALNGLFAIDDTKDSDDEELYLSTALTDIEGAKSREELMDIYHRYPTLQSEKRFTSALTSKKAKLQ